MSWMNFPAFPEWNNNRVIDEFKKRKAAYVSTVLVNYKKYKVNKNEKTGENEKNSDGSAFLASASVENTGKFEKLHCNSCKNIR